MNKNVETMDNEAIVETLDVAVDAIRVEKVSTVKEIAGKVAAVVAVITAIAVAGKKLIDRRKAKKAQLEASSTENSNEEPVEDNGSEE